MMTVAAEQTSLLFVWGSISAPTEQSRRSTACNAVGGALKTFETKLLYSFFFFFFGMFLILLFVYSSLSLCLGFHEPWIPSPKQNKRSELDSPLRSGVPRSRSKPKISYAKKADTLRNRRRRRRQSREYADPTSHGPRSQPRLHASHGYFLFSHFLNKK